MSVKGNVLAAGAPGFVRTGEMFGNGGAVYIYRDDESVNNTFEIKQTLRPPSPAAGQHFGASVELSEDTNTLVIGAPGGFGSTALQTGSVYVYEKDAVNNYILKHTLIDPNKDPDIRNRFGQLV